MHWSNNNTFSSITCNVYLCGSSLCHKKYFLTLHSLWKSFVLSINSKYYHFQCFLVVPIYIELNIYFYVVLILSGTISVIYVIGFTVYESVKWGINVDFSDHQSAHYVSRKINKVVLANSVWDTSTRLKPLFIFDFCIIILTYIQISIVSCRNWVVFSCSFWHSNFGIFYS